MNSPLSLFRRWEPGMPGFSTAFSFFSATAAFSQSSPWILPPFVIGAGFDGEQGFFVMREDLKPFFEAHSINILCMHQAASQLAVIQMAIPAFDIYQLVDQHHVFDSAILHRLLLLATTGEADSDESLTLTECYSHHFPVTTEGTKANSGRLVDYGKWLQQPLENIEQPYLNQIAQDARSTFELTTHLSSKLTTVVTQNSPQAFGYVSEARLQHQQSQWGIQTHLIQLKAQIALESITRNGLHLDHRQVQNATRVLHDRVNVLGTLLRKHGYMPEGNDTKSLQGALRRLQRSGDFILPMKAQGHFDTSADALEPLASLSPFIGALLEYRSTAALLKTLKNNGAKRTVHPSFNVLVKSGRTSSHGELNAQAIPRDDRIRSCFVPSAGNVFLDCDYKTIELATLAQACLSQLNFSSTLAAFINQGIDLHRTVAAQILNKDLGSVSSVERDKAKAFNFGIPGGMQTNSLKSHIHAKFGISLSDEEVTHWRDRWLDLFPEIRSYLECCQKHFQKNLITKLGIDPAAIGKFFGFQQTCESKSYGAAINTFFKVLREPKPLTNKKAPYQKELIDYVWQCAQPHGQHLSHHAQIQLKNRQASPSLSRALREALDQGLVITQTGRLRSNASTTSSMNTIFQGLAADGAKLALWKLWRAGFRIVNFIHDQVLLEIPVQVDYSATIEKLKTIMIQAMREVTPSLEIQVTAVIRRQNWADNSEK